MPEHISKDDYRGLAIEITAMSDSGIIDRFPSTSAMANWLSCLLLWQVDYRQLRRAITRFRTRDNSKEDPERYVILRDFYRNQFQIYSHIRQKDLSNQILWSNVVK